MQGDHPVELICLPSAFRGSYHSSALLNVHETAIPTPKGRRPPRTNTFHPLNGTFQNSRKWKNAMVLLPEAEAEAKSMLSGAPDRHADRNPSLQVIRHRTPSPVQWKAELKATHSGLQWERANWLVLRNNCKHLLLGVDRARSTCHSMRVGVRRQLLEFIYQLAPRGSWEWSLGRQAWL